MLKWPEVPKDTAGKALTWMANPWMLYHKGFRVMENVYFVGTSWVSVFLLDTAEGLVLIDCAMQENVYQIVDNIRSLGFDPHKIKKLLLTHGHFDHTTAVRPLLEKYPDVPVYIHRKDTAADRGGDLLFTPVGEKNQRY